MRQSELTNASRTRMNGGWAAALVILFSVIAAVGVGLSSKARAAVHRLHFHCNFTPKERSEWNFQHPEDWAIKSENGMHYLHMIRGGAPGVPRRPVHFALLKNMNVGSFDLHVKVRRAGHSMMIVFNYVDTMHFYYTHISGDRNVENHNGIFIVNGAPRKQVAGFGVKPALPDKNWHTIRVVRNVNTGAIEVYSPDVQEAPLFTWNDKNFKCGLIGVGSFDEAGDFADFNLNSNDAGCAPSGALKAFLQPPNFEQ